MKNTLPIPYFLQTSNIIQSGVSSSITLRLFQIALRYFKSQSETKTRALVCHMSPHELHFYLINMQMCAARHSKKNLNQIYSILGYLWCKYEVSTMHCS